MRCGDCFFWVFFPGAKGRSGGSVYGACHEGPPSMQDLNGEVFWPATSENDWCGSFRPREAVAARSVTDGTNTD
jgi:hypothetical protein